MQFTVTPLAGLPQIKPGDDLCALLIAAMERANLSPRPRDILAVTSKIVSKAEGRYLDLARITPTPRAQELAAVTGKDARLVEAVLSQSAEVVRAKKNVLIAALPNGMIMANAGIDQSNLGAGEQGRRVLLLPEAPDRSAEQMKLAIDLHFKCEIGVVITDSVGRPWRLGTVGLAIGAAGVPALWDRRGELDMAGRPLEVTEVAFADAVAASAVLAMGEAAEGRPAALVRGLDWTAKPRAAQVLIRPKHEDMFR
jgi:coenzyme F420-0:L-glutamate ligase / coenzyme F420-1:gamma-L-glutamate ligase